jgi:hypothetical protein
MARQDTVAGIYNYPVPLTSYASITETALLAPFSSGYYPAYPSPGVPLSTSTYPVVLPLGVNPDVAGGEFDGHAFEVKITGTVTGAATCTFLIKLYNVTNAVLTSGITSATYATLLTHGPSGTGITALVSSSAVTLSSTVKTNFSLVAPFIWDSTSKQLNFANAPVFYEIGATATPTVSNASVASIGSSDLNFLPTFTWGTAFGGSLVLTEFVINRL